ncbi:hypothetical protein a10_02062 [Streptomyces acidiscabies]|nr:hypothetical protein a10_02062 [Streptomyces acidiscabies]GAV41356.1 hypothetical protein Saa2_04260 [Streptomyces acidiscabies]
MSRAVPRACGHKETVGSHGLRSDEDCANCYPRDGGPRPAAFWHTSGTR